MNRRTFLHRVGAALALAAVPPILHRLPDESRTEPGMTMSMSVLFDSNVPTTLFGWHTEGVGFVGLRVPKGDGWHHTDIYVSRTVVRAYLDGVRVRPVLSPRPPAGLRAAYAVRGLPEPFPTVRLFAPVIAQVDDLYIVDGKVQS